MKRDIGLCLWTFGPIAFEEKCKYAAEIGVDGVITQSVVKLKEILNKYGDDCCWGKSLDISKTRRLFKRVNQFL